MKLPAKHLPSPPTWPSAYPGHIALGPSEVVCWQLNLDSVSLNEITQAYESLTVYEQKRFHSFRLKDDKVRFSLGRLLLRKIIEESLGETFTLEVNAFGKPELTSTKTRFSISHSGNIIMVAVSRSVEVGVDVEQMLTLVDQENMLALLHFSEKQEINSLHPNLRERAFFEIWVSKEAIAKAHGHGLSLPLTSYRVTCLSDNSCKLLQADWGEVSDWHLIKLSIQAGYAGSLAIRSNNKTVSFYNAKLTT
jgi:4'-phosphopantetheinyl transferase